MKRPEKQSRRDREESSDESAQSELFESNEPPIASGKSALASKGKPALVEAKGQKVPVQLPSRPPAGTPKAMPSSLARAETKRLADDRKEMRRLRRKSRALDQAEAQNDRERKSLQEELKALRQKRRAEDAAASVAEEERAKKKKADDEAAAKKKAEEAEAQRKADEEEAHRIAKEEESKKIAEELQKAVDTAYQLQKEANKAERKAQRAAEKAEREPEESDQKAKKVRKAEKAKAKAEEARSRLKAERGAVSHLRWHGNRVGMPRIDFLHDKPEGWKDMWNQRLAAWKARQKKKEDQEKVKGEQPDESGDKEKKSEPERRVTDCRPRGRFRWLRIHGAVLRFSGTRVGIASANYPKRRRARDSSTSAARRDVARPSKINLRICNTYGRNVIPQAIQVRRLQSAGQPTSLLWRSLGTRIILILNWLRNNKRN